MNIAIGVSTTSITVFEKTWAFATSVAFPGGMFGPRTQMTSGSAISVRTTVMSAIRRA